MKKRYVIDSRWFMAVLVMILGLAASPSPGAATHITCGAVLGPGGTFTLDSNVGPCLDPVVITVNAATLNLNGFTVSGTAVGLTGQHCVELIGTRATLRGPGTVQGCERGVVVLGDGRHVVRDVVSQLNTNNGFIVGSSNNRVFNNTSTLNTFVGFALGSLGQFNLLTNNMATSNGVIGFQITGASHVFANNIASGHGGNGFEVVPGLAARITLIRNTASSNDGDGFSVGGDQNGVLFNTASGNLSTGLSFSGDSNEVDRNSASSNGANGIEVEVGATGNRLQENVGLNNLPFDLADDNPACDQNRWRRNTGTRNQGCIH